MSDATSNVTADAVTDLIRSCERDRFELRMLDAVAITATIAAEMLSLFRASFGTWPWSEPGVPELDYLRWKISGPASQIGSYQGRIDGRLVYATTAFSAWARVRGTRRLRVVLLDACVDPAYQGRGIFSRAVAYRQHVLRYRCDFSMHERSQKAAIERGLAKRGHGRMANRVTTLSRVLAPGGTAAEPRAAGLSRLLTSLRDRALWTLGAVVASTQRAPRFAAPAQTITRFDARFDALFEDAAKGFDWIGERDAAFMAWRFGDPRAGRHVVRALGDERRLLGFSAVRLKGNRAYLEDLLALPGRTDVVETLVADAIELARAHGAAILECWLPRHHPYRPSLRRHGFFDRGHDPGISYHAVEMPPEELRFLEDPQARVHFMLADTDLV
jgi:hypothetical protein